MNKNQLNPIFFAIAIVLSAIIFSEAFKSYKTKSTISVTGLGSKDFTSDLIVWSGFFERKNIILKEAYAEIDKDRTKINGYLLSKQVKPSEIVFSAIEIEKEYDNVLDKDGNTVKSIFTGYRLKQNLQIESDEVAKIEEISRQITELINSGVEFCSEKPKYYYTKLKELKI
jgi:hypothetical protein